MTTNPALRRALETLLTPLGYGVADEWRDAVNRDLRSWIGTDAAFFRISDGSPTRMDPLAHDLFDARDDYRSGGFRTLDPWATLRGRPGQIVVGTSADLIGSDAHHRSAFHHELLRPHRIGDLIGARVDTERGGHAVLSYFNVGESRGEEHLARTRRRLWAVMPAFRSGLDLWLTVRPRFRDSGGMVDEVPQAMLFCDDRGRTVHANSAFLRLIETEPEADRLRRVLAECARDFSRAWSEDRGGLGGAARQRRVRTASGTYRIRPVAAGGFLRSGLDEGVAISVQREFEVICPTASMPS